MRSELGETNPRSWADYLRPSISPRTIRDAARNRKGEFQLSSAANVHSTAISDLYWPVIAGNAIVDAQSDRPPL